MAKTIVRLKDIAERCGVSINTASRALRDCSDIGETTKKKIKKIAEDMGYVPNTISDFMRSGGKTNFVGVVVSSTTNPYFTICINEIVKKLQGINYYPMIFISHNSILDKELLMKMLSMRVCSIVCFSDVDDEVCKYCYDIKLPLVLVGITPRNKYVNSLYPDGYKCGKLVADEFLRMGKKRPAYVNCDNVVENEYRRRGFSDRLTKEGVKFDDYFCRFESEPSVNSALCRQIIENGNDFLFCFNDEIASVMLDLLESAGRSDITVFGVDGISQYLRICRKIPSVGADFGHIVGRCVEILLHKIDHDDKIYQEVYPTSIC